jgi:hypothetical protein
MVSASRNSPALSLLARLTDGDIHFYAANWCKADMARPLQISSS